MASARTKPAPGVDDTAFDPADEDLFLDVVEELSSIGGLNWKLLSSILGVSQADVDRIRENNPGDAYNKQQEIIRAWIDNGEASWAILASALKDKLIKKAAYANKIAKKHPKTNSDTTSTTTSTSSTATPAPTALPDQPPAISELNRSIVDVKKRQIEARLQEPEFQKTQGIIFVVGVYGADGTANDVANVEKTFREVNFAVFVVRDPPAEELACLMQAAAEVEYPYKYDYVAFYFAGHGGTDVDSGNMYIVGLQTDDSEITILPVEKYIISPLKCLQKKDISRLFFFDCCQSEGKGTEFRGPITKRPKSVAGELIAYATNKGEKSWGDRTNGGIWTYHLCKNIRESEEDIIRIVTKTTDDVTNAKGTFQQPLTVFNLGTRYLKKKKETTI